MGIVIVILVGILIVYLADQNTVAGSLITLGVGLPIMGLLLFLAAIGLMAAVK